MFRPIRQERLRLAIEEVLRTSLVTEASQDASGPPAPALLEVDSSSHLSSLDSAIEPAR